MEWIKKWLPSIVFNLAEASIIILSGVSLRLEPKQIIFVLAAFLVTRLAAGNPKHYKAWQKCLIWSTLIFLSLFVVAKANVAVSVLLATFGALILSGKADIGDMFMWNPKGQSKHQAALDAVKYGPTNPDLIAFEERLKSDNDNLTYMCYKYIFKDGRSWSETAELLDTDTARLTPIVDKLAFCIRMSVRT